MLVLTVGQERSAPTVFDTGQNVWALTFTASGEYFLSSQEEKVRVWRVKDGKQVARMEATHYVYSLAALKNVKWIAAGTKLEVLVWDAETYEQVLKHEEGGCVFGVDFSPDSTQLVAGTNKRPCGWQTGANTHVTGSQRNRSHRDSHPYL